ncbi:uncharacterized protein DUF1453 [Herbihabitans rhizosphaerae]|uniref:Uncharacterized protein DUF1453 n=1 Tax=Herbihabitans rhizosphaerae TaxID=1872711 RepID=A0A4Q7L2W3_9PSEU|nr:CcdC protein domain-containing protein [Herbihabitans rhizosphaerae]RZS43466.1 uncharacterized protein DUF1453 [Herbihabitans rhizosphaerae]
MLSPVLWIVVAVAVVTVVVKRFLGEPMYAREVFVLPLVLLGVGVYSLREVPLTGIDITWIVIGGVVGLAFGALRGTTTKIYVRDGVLWQRYTRWTVVVWITSLVGNAGVGFLAVAMGMHHEARPMTLSIGIGLVGEMITVGLRALSTNTPFAQDERQSRGSVLDRLSDPSRATNDRPLDSSPTVRDGIRWLTSMARDRRE